jgi:lipopolysaccharide transport system permease protein
MRDVQFIWRVVVQAGFFATPILYPLDIIPEKYRWLFLLNPIARVIISLRNSIIYHIYPKIDDLAYIMLSSLICLVVGWVIFKYLEPRFAEEI